MLYTDCLETFNDLQISSIVFPSFNSFLIFAAFVVFARVILFPLIRFFETLVADPTPDLPSLLLGHIADQALGLTTSTNFPIH